MTARQTWTLILVVVAVLGMGIWLGMPETTSGNYAEVPTRPTAEPTTSPTATADRSNRVVTDRPERVAWRPLPTGFSDRMQPLLKRGAQLEIAAEEFTSAEQFATDAQSRLGGIRTANQGVFQILPRDQIPGGMEEDQIEKIVRVVSTIDYLLAD